MTADQTGGTIASIESDLQSLRLERERLVAAIAAGGHIDELVRLRTRDERRKALESQRSALRAQRRVEASESAKVREELNTLAQSWRQVLASEPAHARRS